MTFLIIQHLDLKIEHTSFRSMDTFGGKTCIRLKRTAGEEQQRILTVGV